MSRIYDDIKRIARLRNVTMKHVAEEELGLSWETVRKWNRFEPSIPNQKKVLIWLSKQEVHRKTALSLDMTSVNADKQVVDAIVIEEGEKAEISEEFWQQLKTIYEGHPDGKENWIKERDLLVKIVEQISKAIAPKYKVESPIQHGGTSVIIKVIDTMLKSGLPPESRTT